MGLGALADVSAKQARVDVSPLRAMVAKKIDPLELREKQVQAAVVASARAGATFKTEALEFIATHRTSWKNAKHITQWENTLQTYVYPQIGEVSVADVDVAMVLKVLKPIWSTKTESATRIRARIELVLDAARAKGLRSGENPARWKGNLEALLPAPGKIAPHQHHPALPFKRMPHLVGALRKREGVSSLCLQFAILTACRSGEALNATWKEVDLEERLWTIPGARMKAGRPHRVPLSQAAIDVLYKAKEGREAAPGDLVFPSPRAGTAMTDMSLTMLLRRLKPGITVHGFRSSFRDWAAELTDYPNEMAEMALAHAVGNKVEAAYRRGDLFEKRRQMMADWAVWCEPKTNVVPIGSKSAA
jgi:integrase